MNKHAIILRMWHNDHNEMEWRLAYFRSCVLPRLQRQIDPDFDICIFSDKMFHSRLRLMDDRIKPFTNTGNDFDYTKSGNFSFDGLIGLEKYEIQTRLDSDDLVNPWFTNRIVNCHRSGARSNVVTFQPELFLLDSLRVIPMKHQYSEKRPSMFSSLYQPDPDKWEFIYKEVFFRLSKYPVMFYPEGTVYMTIHDSNYGTNKNS